MKDVIRADRHPVDIRELFGRQSEIVHALFV